MNKFSLLAFTTLFAFALGTCDFSGDICNLLFNSVSERQVSQCASSSLNSIQIGNNSYPGYEFDVVSLNDVTVTNGDVQGRVATRNNFFALSGVSIADQITVETMYSLIAGGDAIWTGSGETFPLSEVIFVGGSASLPADIQSRVAGNCSSAGCLNSSFDNLSTYWVSVSDSLAQGINNVNVSYLNGVATLACDADSVNNVYYVNIDAHDFNNIVGYSVSSSCSASATWIFNIGGISDVVFNGNSITVAGYVVFNIESGARNILAISSINGNIVAPTASFNQVGGTVYGQVIAYNVTNIIQVNRPSCPSSSSSSSGSAATGSVATGSASGSVATESIASGSTDSLASGSASSSSSASTASNSGGEENTGVLNNESGNTAFALAPAIALLMVALMM